MVCRKEPKRFRRIALGAEDSKEAVFEMILKELDRVVF